MSYTLPNLVSFVQCHHPNNSNEGEFYTLNFLNRDLILNNSVFFQNQYLHSKVKNNFGVDAKLDLYLPCLLNKKT